MYPEAHNRLGDQHPPLPRFARREADSGQYLGGHIAEISFL